MKRNTIIIAAFLLTATMAFAGMGGGGMPGTPSRPGNTGGQMPGAFGGGMNGMALTVAEDGTVLTVRHIAGDPDAPGSGTVEVVAISSTGGTLWTWAAEGGVHQLELAGDLVLVSSTTWSDDHEPGVPQGGLGNDSVLHALAIHSGAELWQLTFEGRLMNLEPSTNVIYAVVADHELIDGTPGDIIPRGGMGPQQPGYGMGELELVAISLDGSVVWTAPLNQ